MSFSDFIDFIGQIPGSGKFLVLGIPTFFITLILVGGAKGLYRLFGNKSNPEGGSLVKKFRKKIGMCCLIVALAIAIPLASLVKKYI